MKTKLGSKIETPSAGGRRAGAGRPPAHPLLKKTPRMIKLPEWLWLWLDEQDDSRPVTIEDALRHVHKIRPPAV